MFIIKTIIELAQFICYLVHGSIIQNNFNGWFEEQKAAASSVHPPVCVDTADVYICKCMGRLITILAPRAHLKYRPHPL